MTKTAFVLGNGTSRKGIDPNQLKSFGKIYGCNALYREFEPDYLIAVDTKMVLEINKSGYQHSHEVWTNRNKAFNNFSNINFFPSSKGWSSGPTALHMASDHNFDLIYILGFDYQGLGKYVNNIYSDTFNYKKSHDKATYFGNWLKQTTTTIQRFPKKRYIRVIENDGFVPKELSKLPNLEHIDIENFKEKFSIS